MTQCACVQKTDTNSQSIRKIVQKNLFAPIFSQRLKIQQFANLHSAQVAKYLIADELACINHFDWPINSRRPYGNEDYANIVRDHLDECDVEDDGVLLAILNLNDEVIGHISVYKDHENHLRMGAYFMLPSARGNGYMEEAYRLVATRLAVELKNWTIYAKVEIDNIPSLKIMNNLNFTAIGASICTENGPYKGKKLMTFTKSFSDFIAEPHG